MTKRHIQQPNGVWTFEVTLDDVTIPPRTDAMTSRPVPEASVIPCLSPSHMAQWLAIDGAAWRQS